MLVMSDQRQSWAMLSVGFPEDTHIHIYIHIYIYVWRVDKEELEVVKWIWLSVEKNGKR